MVIGLPWPSGYIQNMSRGNLILNGIKGLVLAFLLSGMAINTLLAGDFWSEKPYTQWTAEETLHLLSNSPWCKTYYLKPSGKTGETSRIPEGALEPGEATITRHSTCCKTFETVKPPTPGHQGGDTSSNISDRPTPTPGLNSGGNILSYRVLWLSSVCIRKAMTRALQLQGVEPTDAVKQAVGQPAEEFVIAVAGTWMAPFEEAVLERLKENVYLRSVRASQKSLSPSGYISPKERQDGMAVFIFPRIFDGKPAFERTDKEVEFGFQDGSFKIQARFKLEKMILNGSPDL